MNDKILLNHQRKALGILCALLAPLCLGFGLFGLNTNAEHWWYSISATYYANSKMFLIGLLFTIFIYFLSYKGYDLLDRISTIVAAIASIMIVAFPCNCPGAGELVGIFNIPVNISAIVHNISAAILFTDFAFMICFAFTKTSGEMTKEKKTRNTIYYVCAGIIVLFEIWQLITALIDFFEGYWTIINEFIMLLAFSFAWLTKGGMFKKLNDKDEQTTTVSI